MSKAAILGTSDYHATMRCLAQTGLQRMAGHIAPVLDIQDDTLAPVDPDYLERADPMMQALVGDDTLVNCNSRSPYLFLAWLMVGSDNPYRSCQHVKDASIYKQVAIIHIRIAFGVSPSTGEINAAAALTAARIAALTANWTATTVWAATAALTANWTVTAAKAATTFWAATAALTAARTATLTANWTATEAADAFKTKALSLAHISDSEAIQIARQLTIDILNMKASSDDER